MGQSIFLNSRPKQHLYALGLFGVIIALSVFCKVSYWVPSYLHDGRWPIYAGYVLFFLVTAAPMLKQMIIFSIILGGLAVIFPILAPVILVVVVILFFVRISYVFKNWRPIVAGLAVYGVGLLLAEIRWYYISLLANPLGVFTSKVLYSLNRQGLLSAENLLTWYSINEIFVAIVAGLFAACALDWTLCWLYRHGYNYRSALGIMGAVPLVVISFVLPFLKLHLDTGHIGDIHAPGGDAIDVTPTPSQSFHYHGTDAYAGNLNNTTLGAPTPVSTAPGMGTGHVLDSAIHPSSPVHSAPVIDPQPFAFNPTSLHTTYILNQMGFADATIQTVGGNSVIFDSQHMVQGHIQSDGTGGYIISDKNMTELLRVNNQGWVMKNYMNVGRIIHNGTYHTLVNVNGSTIESVNDLTGQVSDANGQFAGSIKRM